MSNGPISGLLCVLGAFAGEKKRFTQKFTRPQRELTDLSVLIVLKFCVRKRLQKTHKKRRFLPLNVPTLTPKSSEKAG